MNAELTTAPALSTTMAERDRELLVARLLEAHQAIAKVITESGDTIPVEAYDRLDLAYQLLWSAAQEIAKSRQLEVRP